MLEPRLHRTQDEQAGVQAIAGAHRPRAHQRVEQRRVILGRDRREALRRVEQVVDEARRLLAVVLPPQPLRSGQFVVGGQRFAEGDMGAHEVGQRRLGGQRLQERGGALADVDQPCAQELLLFLMVEAVGLLQRRQNAVEPLRRTGATQHDALQRAGGGAEIRRVAAARRHRVLGQRQQGQRMDAARHQFRRQAQIGADRGMGERLAAGVVDQNAPARQRHGDPAAQVAVGGDQRRGLGRRFQRMAHQQCDNLRLLFRGGGVDAGQPVQRRGIYPRQLAPALGGRRRPHRLGDQAGAGAARLGRVGPGLHLLPFHAEMADQLRQPVLWVGFILLNRLPDLVLGPGVEAGQHHRPLRQPGDDREQVGGGDDGAGGAGGDHHARRRGGLPESGLGFQRQVPSLGRVGFSGRFEDGGPVSNDDVEKF